MPRRRPSAPRLLTAVFPKPPCTARAAGRRACGPAAGPARWPARGRRSRRRGYILLEALAALGVFSAGILPSAWLAPVTMQWWRDHGATAHALRIAAEAAELAGLTSMAATPLPPAVPLVSLRHARGLPTPRWCMSVPDTGASLACPPGPRIVMAGPLAHRPPPVPGQSGPSVIRGLLAVALWSRP